MYVRRKAPGDLAVDFVIVLLLVFTVVAVLYPPCGSWSSHRSPTRMPWPAAK